MLARRFTMICLLTSVFGMLFASLVARPDQPRFNDDQSQQLRCAIVFNVHC